MPVGSLGAPGSRIMVPGTEEWLGLHAIQAAVVEMAQMRRMPLLRPELKLMAAFLPLDGTQQREMMGRRVAQVRAEAAAEAEMTLATAAAVVAVAVEETEAKADKAVVAPLRCS